MNKTDPSDSFKLEDLETHIQAKNFSIFYRNHKAVAEVNIEIKKGIVTAIIGPSGCGKSTFLRAINRMNDLIPGCHVTGELLFDGENVYGANIDDTALRHRIGMVFQKPNPFPKSIYDNVAYGPRLHGTNSRAELDLIVEESLRGAALWDEVKDRLTKNALGLSGGQAQRLCLARALAVKPEVLLMDEPTSALDPKTPSPSSPTICNRPPACLTRLPFFTKANSSNIRIPKPSLRVPVRNAQKTTSQEGSANEQDICQRNRRPQREHPPHGG